MDKKRKIINLPCNLNMGKANKEAWEKKLTWILKFKKLATMYLETAGQRRWMMTKISNFVIQFLLAIEWIFAFLHLQTIKVLCLMRHQNTFLQYKNQLQPLLRRCKLMFECVPTLAPTLLRWYNKVSFINFRNYWVKLTSRNMYYSFKVQPLLWGKKT